MTDISIIIALLGIVGPLCGVWLGRHLERSSEAMKWRRDRCLEAYTDALIACDKVLIEATNVHVKGEPNEKVTAEIELLFTKATEMFRAQDRVTLIGPPELDAALRNLTRHYHQNLAQQAIKWPKPSADEWDKLTNEAADLYRTVVLLARKDLGVIPLRRDTRNQLLRFDQSLLM